jgi:accessory gene regulator protein AgrB
LTGFTGFKGPYFACGETCFSAVGHFILSILLILSDTFLLFGMDSNLYILLGQDLQDLLDFFIACGEAPFGRRPFYPDNPVDPV